LDESGKPIEHRPLSSYMGEITMQRLTGKLLIEDGRNKGELHYEEGKLRHVTFAGLTGVDALEAAKSAKFLQTKFVQGEPIPPQ
jgi:hypothetical protein